VTVDGHKVNTIALDDERAPHIRIAFELRATGRYANMGQLRDKLTDAGLRMPTTGKPVSVQTLWKMLRDRYYTGYVVYKGVEYPGRHEPLISEELFDRAQRVLDSHSGSGTRQRTHHHYLKGVVWCARCKQRFIVQRTKGRHGGIYYYFFCGGREDKTCDQPYVPVEIMEQAVEAHYGDAVWLPDEFRAQVRAAVDAAVATNHSLTDEMRDQYTRRLDKLDAKESYLLDLASEEGWPKDKLREKVQAFDKNANRSGTNSTKPSNVSTPAGRSSTEHWNCWTTRRPFTSEATRRCAASSTVRSLPSSTSMDTRSPSMSYKNHLTSSARPTSSTRTTDSTNRHTAPTADTVPLRRTEPPYPDGTAALTSDLP
jgi:hypothetical protein